MPSLRAVSTSAPASDGAATVARPSGLQTTDTVILLVAADATMGTVSSSGFTLLDSWDGSQSLAVLVGNGFSAGGSFTVSSSGSAWKSVTAMAWEDVDDVRVGTGLTTSEQVNVVPAVSWLDGSTGLVVATKSYASLVAEPSGGTQIASAGTGGGAHVSTWDLGAQSAGAGSTAVVEWSNTRAAVHVQLSLDPPADEPEPAEGSTTGSFGFTGTAVGRRIARGVAAGLFGFAGLAAGHVDRSGDASGTVGFTGSASSAVQHRGTTTGTVGFDGEAHGAADHRGTATGSFGFTGAAISSSAATGHAAGTFEFTGTAVGHAESSGTAAGTFTVAGAATGHTDPHGSTAGTFAFVGAARSGDDGPFPLAPLWRTSTVEAEPRTTTIPHEQRNTRVRT